MNVETDVLELFIPAGGIAPGDVRFPEGTQLLKVEYSARGVAILYREPS